MWDRKVLKQRGKAAFKANYWKCVLVAFLLVVFVAGSSVSAGRRVRSTTDAANGSGSVSVSAESSTQNITVTAENGQFTVNGVTYGSLQEAITAVGQAQNASPEEIAKATEFFTTLQENPEAIMALGAMVAAMFAAIAVISLIGALLRILLINPLNVGCHAFFLRNADQPAELSEIKTGFHPYWRSVGALLLRDVFISLWSLLLIVPGIIKAYSYRMVPYILADDPGISGKEAIDISRQMMDGQKWNAFGLDLSFIGWHLLSCVTFGLAGLFFVNPYVQATDAELYLTLLEQK